MNTNKFEKRVVLNIGKNVTHGVDMMRNGGGINWAWWMAE